MKLLQIPSFFLFALRRGLVYQREQELSMFGGDSDERDRLKMYLKQVFPGCPFKSVLARSGGTAKMAQKWLWSGSTTCFHPEVRQKVRLKEKHNPSLKMCGHRRDF